MSGNTYFTKDLYKSADKAAQKLSLKNTPTLRVEFEILNNPEMILNGSKVSSLPGLSGGGADYMTNQSVLVRLLNWQKLR